MAGKENIINLKGAGREAKASAPDLRPGSLQGEGVSKDRPVCVRICLISVVKSVMKSPLLCNTF